MAPDPAEPGINLGSVRNLVCPRHEAALAADPSVNALAFPIKVAEAAMRDARTVEACAGQAERIGPFLVSVAPVCEWIAEDDRAWAWAEARRLGSGARA